jgi:hypothetical protein
MSYQARSGRLGQLVSLNLLHAPLMVISILLGLVGVMVLYSVAGGDFAPWAWRHAVRLAVGFLLMYAIANLDLRTLFNLAYPIFGGIFLLLVAVEVFGDTNMGAQRWLDLGFVTIQPSEFMRFALIMALARCFPTFRLAGAFGDDWRAVFIGAGPARFGHGAYAGGERSRRRVFGGCFHALFHWWHYCGGGGCAGGLELFARLSKRARLGVS